jgi:hypothetical protein
MLYFDEIERDATKIRDVNAHAFVASDALRAAFDQIDFVNPSETNEPNPSAL